ncbi:MAG: GNAT family N-acetyltransferase [Blastococcus sp.]
MPTLTVAHTGHLDPAVLAAARALLDEAFGGRFDDADWQHALGGMHVVAFDGDRLVAHGAVVQRQMVHRGRALRVGYVEAVAVAGDHRRRGLASAVMDELEQIIRGGYDLGALSASDAGAALYLSRGWRRWDGPTAVRTPTGTVRTPEEDGNLFVLPGGTAIDPAGDLVCDWRDGDVW